MRRIAIIFILTLLLSGCQLLNLITATATPLPPTAAIPPSSTPPPPAPTFTSVPALPTLTPAKPILLVSKILSDSSEYPGYTLKVVYPQIQGAETPQSRFFNNFSEKMARDLLNSYQKQLADSQGTPDPNFHPSFMEATYQVTNGTHGLLSILFTIADYWSGAAHPNQYAYVLNFNLIAGKEISLGDLFLPGANYLKALSDYCVADLKKQDRLMFEAGAQPTTDNYQNWNITPEGLRVSFDPYQVGPYAMGPSSVTIPYANLMPILNPAGPLAAFIQ